MTEKKSYSDVITLYHIEDSINNLSLAVASIIEENQSLRPPTIWNYDVRFPTPVHNLYDVEYSASTNKRWVGPEPSVEFQPHLKAGRTYKITVSVPNFINDEAEATFRFRLNGIVTKPVPVGPGLYESSFSAENNNYQRVELFSNVVVSPLDSTGADDVRLLSFSISFVHIVELA